MKNMKKRITNDGKFSKLRTIIALFALSGAGSFAFVQANDRIEEIYSQSPKITTLNNDQIYQKIAELALKVASNTLTPEERMSLPTYLNSLDTAQLTQEQYDSALKFAQNINNQKTKILNNDQIFSSAINFMKRSVDKDNPLSVDESAMLETLLSALDSSKLLPGDKATYTRFEKQLQLQATNEASGQIINNLSMDNSVKAAIKATIHQKQLSEIFADSPDYSAKSAGSSMYPLNINGQRLKPRFDQYTFRDLFYNPVFENKVTIDNSYFYFKNIDPNEILIEQLFNSATQQNNATNWLADTNSVFNVNKFNNWLKASNDAIDQTMAQYPAPSPVAASKEFADLAQSGVAQAYAAQTNSRSSKVYDKLFNTILTTMKIDMDSNQFKSTNPLCNAAYQKSNKTALYWGQTPINQEKFNYWINDVIMNINNALGIIAQQSSSASASSLPAALTNLIQSDDAQNIFKVLTVEAGQLSSGHVAPLFESIVSTVLNVDENALDKRKKDMSFKRSYNQVSARAMNGVTNWGEASQGTKSIDPAKFNAWLEQTVADIKANLQ